MHPSRSLGPLGVVLAVALSARAESSQDQARPVSPELHVERSGLTVVLAPEPGHGTVAVCTTFPAGPVYDTQSGGALARAVAETLREGGRRASSSEYSRLMQSRGAEVELSIGPRLVQFCSVAPAHELDLAIWLESGRHRPHAFTEENFAERLRDLELTEQEAPLDEVHRRVRFLAHPERSAGADPELTPTLDRARRFQAAHYALDHEVVSIAGDFEPKAAKRLVGTRFDGPPRALPVPAPPPEAPRQSSPRYSSIERPSLLGPVVERGFLVPGLGTREHDALTLAARILAGGEGSILHERLVGHGLATRVGFRADDQPGTDLLAIWIEGTPSLLSADGEKIFEEALVELRSAIRQPDRLGRARREAARVQSFGLESSLEQARFLGRRVALGGSSDRLAEPVESQQVSPEDLSQAVAKYFLPLRSIVVELLPKEAKTIGPPTLRVHVVTPGDNLTTIARRYGTSVERLAEENGIQPKETLHPGQKLRLPRGSKPEQKYVVRAGDTLIGIAKRHRVSLKALLERNRLDRRAVIRVGQELTIPR